jgi:hypothetical protein
MTFKKETPVWEHGGSSSKMYTVTPSIPFKHFFVNLLSPMTASDPENPSFLKRTDFSRTEGAPGTSFLPLRASVGQPEVQVKGLIPTIYASECVKLCRRIVLVNRRGNQLNLSVSFLQQFRLVSIVTPDEALCTESFNTT